MKMIRLYLCSIFLFTFYTFTTSRPVLHQQQAELSNGFDTEPMDGECGYDAVVPSLPGQDTPSDEQLRPWQINQGRCEDKDVFMV